MKVLHLITSLNPGGIERWILTMLENTDRTKCEMDVCCKGLVKGPWTKLAEGFGAKVFWFPLMPDHITFGLVLAGLLKKGRYDMLHVHTGAYSGLPVWIAKLMHVKVITTFHNVKFSPHYWMLNLSGIKLLRKKYADHSIRYAVNKSDFLVGVSKQSIRAFVPERADLLDKCRLIYHGVKLYENVEGAVKNDFRHRLGWPSETELIVNVGRFNPQKNHAGVLEIFEKVISECPMARLVLIGEGILKPEIENLAVRMRLIDKIAFMGRCDNAAEIIRYCDLMLMPSIYEGFGIAAIEASAAGIPVIASKVAGLTEAVVDGQTGLLFHHLDYGGMAAGIIRLLEDVHLRNAMGQAGFENVRKNFSIEAMIGQYMDLYSKCLS